MESASVQGDFGGIAADVSKEEGVKEMADEGIAEGDDWTDGSTGQLEDEMPANSRRNEYHSIHQHGRYEPAWPHGFKSVRDNRDVGEMEDAPEDYSADEQASETREPNPFLTRDHRKTVSRVREAVVWGIVGEGLLDSGCPY